MTQPSKREIERALEELTPAAGTTDETPPHDFDEETDRRMGDLVDSFVENPDGEEAAVLEEILGDIRHVGADGG